MIVKVNPKDVVCVPHDHNSTKIRVCEYTVVKDYCQILKSSCYSSEDYEEVDSYFENYEEEYDEGDSVTVNTRSGYNISGTLESKPDSDGYFVLSYYAGQNRVSRVAHIADIVDQDIPF